MFKIKKAKGGYIVYMIAKNGEILMTSEILTTKENAVNNLTSSILNTFRYVSESIWGKKNAPEIMPSLYNDEMENDLYIKMAQKHKIVVTGTKKKKITKTKK